MIIVNVNNKNNSNTYSNKPIYKFSITIAISTNKTFITNKTLTGEKTNNNTYFITSIL